MKRKPPEIFKPEDFEFGLNPYEHFSYKECADVANRILAERGTVVHGQKFSNGNDVYTNYKDDNDTHTALLLDVQPIAEDDTYPVEGVFDPYKSIVEQLANTYYDNDTEVCRLMELARQLVKPKDDTTAEEILRDITTALTDQALDIAVSRARAYLERKEGEK